MIVVAALFLLVMLLRLLSPPPPSARPTWTDAYYERTPEEIARDLRTSELVTRCLANRPRPVRPLLLAQDHGRDRVYLWWPDGREEWMSRLEMNHRRIDPIVDPRDA